MRRLLDANIVIEMIGGNLEVLRRSIGLVTEETAIPAIAYAEVLFGLESQPVNRDAVRAALDSIVEAIPVLPFDEAAARGYARVPFRRHRFDRLIAAHALALGAAIVTRNPQDFADVPDLAVEDWS